MTRGSEPTPPSHWDESQKPEALEIFHKAYECQMRGEMDQATSLYQRSIALYPTAEAHTFLGWAYSFQGRYDDAINECRKAIQLDPEFGNPYNDIGAYLIEKNRLDEAIPWLEKAIEAKRYDSYCFPYYNLGRVWELKGDWPKALECYQSALKDNPDYTLASRALSRLGGLLN